MLIKEVSAKEIFDSRGEKTIEVSVNGSVASSPSGKSTGKHETPQYHESLTWNVDFLNNWKKWIEVNSFEDLERVEAYVKDRTKIKDVKDFGANALYAFESAILKALAKEQGKELWQVVNKKAKKFPRPVGNAIGGGLHSSAFKTHPLFQEFLIVPKEDTFAKNVGIMQELYDALGKYFGAKKKNDEGAWHVGVGDETILEKFQELASPVVDYGIDIASSSFYKGNLYDYGKIKRTRGAHLEHILSVLKMYKPFYIEDPVEEEDFEGFGELKKSYKLGMFVGDDLVVTHIDRLHKAIENKSVNAIIVKPNQNGSLLELKQIFEICKKAKIKTVMSHRSGETMDDALADYAFAFGADFIKCGISTPWREAKLKRMEEIEKSRSGY